MIIGVLILFYLFAAECCSPAVCMYLTYPQDIFESGKNVHYPHLENKV